MPAFSAGITDRGEAEYGRSPFPRVDHLSTCDQIRARALTEQFAVRSRTYAARATIRHEAVRHLLAQRVAAQASESRPSASDGVASSRSRGAALDVPGRIGR